MYNQLYNIYKKLYKMHPDNFLSYLSHITESPLLLQDIVKSFKNIRQKTIKSGLMFLDLSNYLFTMSLFCILSLLAKTIKGLLFCRSLPQGVRRVRESQGAGQSPNGRISEAATTPRSKRTSRANTGTCSHKRSLLKTAMVLSLGHS